MILACDVLGIGTLGGQRRYVLAVIEHATRRIRIVGAAACRTAVWVARAARNLAMDLKDAGVNVRCLIRDRDAKYPARFDQVLRDAGIEVVLTGIRMPRMNAIMERWVQTCRRELLDRTLIRNRRHLQHALRQFEIHYNGRRPRRAVSQAAPLCVKPEPITKQAQIVYLDVRRRDRVGGLPHE